ncbi:MAG: hypothetical protein KGJ79_04725 [Alphaproteobacteria bacterium]|nr:hypothetical protein [Alphaproteobacteria bacterium]MDE2493415.1 hypothetical protein [Alphaproteobacteria bacterium]
MTKTKRKIKKKKPSRLTKALLETAKDMHRIGVIDDAVYGKIVTRHRDHCSTI